MFSKLVFTTVLSVGLTTSALSFDDHLTTSPQGASVSISLPADGTVIKGSVDVKFMIKGMKIAPAGTDQMHSGHHHLLIDAPLPALDEGIPADANHVHFGKGQIETTLKLAPGTHTLQLLLGDKNHVPHSPAVYSSIVTITVE